MQFTLSQQEGESLKQSIVDITAAHQAAKTAIDLYNAKCRKRRVALKNRLGELDKKIFKADATIAGIKTRFQGMLNGAPDEYLESDDGRGNKDWIRGMAPKGHETEVVPFSTIDPDEILPNLEQVIKGIEHVFLCD